MDFADIIFTPISDTPLPSDIKNFREWAKDFDDTSRVPRFGSLKQSRRAVYNMFLEKSQMNSNKNVLDELGTYPWDIRFGMKIKKFINGFDELFPDMICWLEDTFETKRSEWLNLTFITVKDDFTNTLESNAWHVDGDYGLRFYIEDEDETCSNNPILFRPTIKPYKNKLALQLDMTLGKFDNLTPHTGLVQNKTLKSEYIPNMTAYYVNNFRACHAPVLSEKKARTAGFLVTKKSHDDFIIRNAHKYKENVLLWTPPTTSA